MKRYTTWGTYCYPLDETHELGHADDLDSARAIAAGCEIAFIYDHEAGHNVDSMVSAGYKRRIGGAWIDGYAGWQSEKPMEPVKVVKQTVRPTFIQRIAQSWRSLWGAS